MPTPSRTAEFMALFRALESARPAGDRLFDDPCAVAFLRPSFRGLVRLARWPRIREGACALLDRAAPGARAAGIARTRRIDDAVDESLAAGIEQVAILGVGFDCRSHRLPSLAGIRVFEVDRPAMLEERARRLGAIGACPLAEPVAVPVDFERERLGDALPKRGFDSRRPTLFLLEGVTHYLSEASVDALLRFAGQAARGSRLLFTYVERCAVERLDRLETTRWLSRALRRFGERWTFGLEPAEVPERLDRAGLELLWDEGSTEYRERHLGHRRGAPRGYEFYRLALARVA